MTRKKLLFIVIVLISSLFTSACRELKYLASDFPPGRIEPTVYRVPLPEFVAKLGFTDYFFEGDGRRTSEKELFHGMVHMQIPSQSYFRSDYAGPIRMHRNEIDMFHPDFSGIGDPENADCRKEFTHSVFRFDCPKLITVTVSFSNTGEDDNQSDIQHIDKHTPSDYVIPSTEELKNRGSIYPQLTFKVKSIRGGTDIYLSYDENGYPEYLFRCDSYGNDRHQECRVKFRSAKSPYISITLQFNRSLVMPEWEKILEKVRLKVDSMIVDTYEFPVNGV